MSELPETNPEEHAEEAVQAKHLALEQDVREAVWEDDARWLSRTLNRLHPADAADLLEQLSTDDFSDAVALLGGALPTGRHLAYQRNTTGDLYTALLRLFGGSDERFGLNGYCSGPLPGLV